MAANISLDGAQAILTYAFKDPRWKMKLLIGALLGFAGFIIPILPGIFLVGYSATIMRQIIVQNEGASLPEWDDWGTLFMRGLRLSGAMFIFFFPIFLLMIIGYFVMMVPLFAEMFSGVRYGADVSRLVGFQILGMFGGMGVFMFGMLLSLLMSFFVPPALAHQVAKDSFAAAFHIRDWWRIFKANLGGFFAALVLIGGLYILLIFVVQMIYMTLILCFLLPILMSLLMIYLSVVSAAAVGEAYRRGVEKLMLESTEA
jgi:hypothetical protein